MKNFILLLLLVFISCDKIPGISDVALTPESSSYSEKNGLLIERYTYPNDTVHIFGNKYIIADAWVTHNFIKRTSKEVKLDYVVFFCSFKNIHTNEYFIDTTLGDFDHVLSHNVDSYGHGFEGLGKKFRHYKLTFIDNEIKNLPDTLEIYVQNGQEKNTLSFYKYSSLYKVSK